MPVRVLDVGGGIGVHAEWLSADGYAVELLDPVPRHVQRAARLAGVSAPLGDARPLPVADASQDAVLLLGSLYHLPDRADRVRDPDRGPARPETWRRDRGCDDQPSRGRARRHLPGALPPGTAAGGRTRSGDERDHAFSWARIPGLPPRPRRGAGEFADAGFPMSNGTAWKAASGCTATSATGWKTRSAEPSCSTRSARWDWCRRCSGSAVTCSASPNAISDTWWGRRPCFYGGATLTPVR